MGNRNLPSQAELNELLHYEPETGKLFWKPRSIHRFKRECNQRSFNTKYAGKEAFTASYRDRGARVGRIGDVGYLAHRIIWKMVTGEEPKIIDHINGKPWDNRFENLRSTCYLGNARNSSIPNTNTSGVIGVSWNKETSKWTAFIGIGKRHVYLGRYHSRAEAIAARKAAEKVLGFHPNHGRQRHIHKR